MFRRLILLVGLAGVVGVVVKEIAPEIRRYLKIREM